MKINELNDEQKILIICIRMATKKELELRYKSYSENQLNGILEIILPGIIKSIMKYYGIYHKEISQVMEINSLYKNKQINFKEYKLQVTNILVNPLRERIVPILDLICKN